MVHAGDAHDSAGWLMRLLRLLRDGPPTPLVLPALLWLVLLAAVLWVPLASGGMPLFWPMMPTPRRHGLQPENALPLQLEPMAIKEAMPTNVSKRRHEMVLLPLLVLPCRSCNREASRGVTSSGRRWPGHETRVWKPQASRNTSTKQQNTIHNKTHKRDNQSHN